MRYLQHIVPVMQSTICGTPGDELVPAIDAPPVFILGFGIMEGIGLLEKILGGR